jgi:hypothetical protein
VSDDAALQTYTEHAIVEDTPFTDVDEARAFLSQTFEHLRRGVEMQAQAEYLLDQCRVRRVWETLGFASWDDCLIQGLSDTFKVTMQKAARLPIVIALRNQGMDTNAIASAVGASGASVRRDLVEARVSGQLRDEPTTTLGADGRAHPVVNQRTERTSRRPRSPFPQAFTNTMDATIRIGKAFAGHGADDRFELHEKDLAGRHLADLGRAIDALLAIQRRLQAASALTEQEN